MGGEPEYLLPIDNGYIFSLKNVGSGKYLNVHMGEDADGTNVYQWDKDNSEEQAFIAKGAHPDFKFHAFCSSLGNGRVLHIDDGVAENGRNVEINSSEGTVGKLWGLKNTGNGYLVIPKEGYIDETTDPSLVLTSYEDSNGTASGTTSTSAGNVFIATYSPSNENQLWQVIPLPPFFEPVFTPSDPISVDTEVQGLIDPTGGADYYDFIPEVTGLYTIEVTDVAENYDVEFHAFLYSGNTHLADAYHVPPDKSFSISHQLQQGVQYYLRVIRRNDQGVGDYKLKVISPPPDAFDLATVISADTDVLGTIDILGDADYYKFVPSVTGLYTIKTADTPATDTHGFLYDSNKALLVNNNNTWVAGDPGYITPNFRMFRVLEAGKTYYVKVIHSQNQGTGPYVLRINAPTLVELQYGALGWEWPTTSLWLTSYYGFRHWGDNHYHKGLDVGVKLEPVKAVAAGKIVKTGNDTAQNGAGKYIVLRTAVGGQNAYVRYLHLDSFAEGIPSQGEDLDIDVQKGAEIATSGNTPREDDGGYHLHFDVNFTGPSAPPFSQTVNPHHFYVNLDLKNKIYTDEPQ